MPVFRLNHAVLYVRDAERSAEFYSRALGFERIPLPFPGAVVMRAAGSSNDHDLGLFSIGDQAANSPAGRSAVGLYHLAWEVDTINDLSEIAAKLAEAGALSGATDHGTTKALYGKDPDGIDFEVSWLVPADLLTDDLEMGSRRLDLQAEMDRYGADTLGGVGVSRPAPAEVRGI